MSLEKVTHSKSILASIGIHAFAVASVSLYFYVVKPKSLELTGLGGGNGSRLISLSSVSLQGPRAGATNNQATAVQEKSRAVVKPDPNAKKVAQAEKVQDTVSAQASAVSQSGPVGAGTGEGSGTGGFGAGLGIGNGVGDFDGGLLFGKIKTYLSNRLDSNLRIDEDQLIKIRLKLASDGAITSAELVEGKLEMINLRKILAVARNIPLKSYWQSRYSLPDELTIPLFLSSSN